MKIDKTKVVKQYTVHSTHEDNSVITSSSFQEFG